ncbi:MAG: hypothetical protein HC898_13330 [Phycisphaerales bacterium]|nr:hypothetical protein [Phycisphaerales bacterium]
MRLIIDTLIAAMLVGILAGILLHYRAEAREVEHWRVVQLSLSRLHEVMQYHKALEEAKSGEVNSPIMVTPLWFEGSLPENPLVPGRQPWMDIAPGKDQGLHPPDPVIRAPHQAAFWYNPEKGVFRARVVPQFTDEATLDLYNKINGSPLYALPAGVDPQRAPRPMEMADSLAGGAQPANPGLEDVNDRERERLLSRPSLINRSATP